MPTTLLARESFAKILRRSVAVPLIVMVLLAAGLIFQIRVLMNAAKLVEHTDQVINRLYEFELLMVDMQSGVRGFLLNGDEPFLKPYVDAKPKIADVVTELRLLCGDRDSALQALVEIDARRVAWVEYAEERIAARRAGQTALPGSYGRGNQLMNEVRQLFTQFIAEETQLRSTRNDVAQRAAQITTWVAGFTAVLIGTCLALLARGQLRWLSRTYEASLARARELSDTLERRVLERTSELTASKEKLEDANRELEAFSYSISHDLRAPMRHISGFANLLKGSTESRLSADDSENLDTIQRTAVLAGRMVDDLLAFSRVGRSQMRSDAVDANALVATVLRDLAPESSKRRVEWVVGELRPMRGDPALLRMAFHNLMSNALKYTATRETAHIEVSSRPEENGTIYTIEDNGVGFDMAYAHKLFGVFQRLHRAEEFEGTGIGLANVRRIIVRHGGRVWAEGVHDVGAKFFVFLPD